MITVIKEVKNAKEKMRKKNKWPRKRSGRKRRKISEPGENEEKERGRREEDIKEINIGQYDGNLKKCSLITDNRKLMYTMHTSCKSILYSVKFPRVFNFVNFQLFAKIFQ